MPEEVKPAGGTATVTTPAAPAAPAATPAKDAAPAAPAVTGSEAAPKDKPSEPTKTTDKPAAPVVPEKYELKLPEGSILEASRLAAIEAYAKENKLTNEQAQKIVDQENVSVRDHFQSWQPGGANWTKQLDSWEGQAKSDPEIGGDHFKENAEIALRVVNKFGSEGFRKELQRTGLGSHPELIRFCVKLGRAGLDDKFVSGGGAPAAPAKSTAEKLYDGGGKQ